ncbi:FAD binding domain-containing protein [Thermocrispum municipale]|uniref:FAD binding domain-containing protein n=1 Tax=Thermocrispum municipale TaxID=37926 RepID=UPI0003FBFC4E|nr:xanthine dehydrogenase family protein subunit M [Thermocrispum municipale]
MYPPRFAYEAPRSLDQAQALLAEYGDEAKVLAGGQSLVPLLKLRFAAPAMLVDINNVPDLEYHRTASDGSLRVGALCRHADLERSTLLAQFPVMASAAPLVADPVVRHRGTLVGSVCHADPQGDWSAVLLALDASIVAVGPEGRRTIPMAEFVLGPFTPALRPGEIAIEAVIPPPQHQPAGSYFKLERRVGDFATAGAAVAVEMDGSRVTRAGIALTGVGTLGTRATAAEEALTGHELTDGSIAEAADAAAESANPQSDHRGSAQFKRHVVRTFVSRALHRVLDAPAGKAA